MIVLDYRDRRPIYEQVIERFEELMFKGVLVQDAKLPSVRSLATELSINPNTIQRAYTELERQGYIYSVKGKGSFVADWSRVRTGMVKEWEKAFDEAVMEGLRIGMTEEEMEVRLKRMAKQAAESGRMQDAKERGRFEAAAEGSPGPADGQMTTERGESHD